MVEEVAFVEARVSSSPAVWVGVCMHLRAWV